jgi:hypothetical protein
MADVKISGLPASTTPLAGTEVLPIVQSGVTKQVSVANLTAGRAIAAESAIISANSASDALRITQTGAGNALLVEDSANPDATPTVIGSDGDIVVGSTTAQTFPSGDGVNRTASIQSQGSSFAKTTIAAALYNTAASVGGATLSLSKSNSATIGSHAVVASGDVLGVVSFNGSDGTNFVRAATIISQVDGTPGTNDMPGRLVFSTTADGASSPTERMRIDNAGRVGIGGTASAVAKLQVLGTLPSSGAFTYGISAAGTIPSTTTSGYVGFDSAATTQATAFTLTNYSHFQAFSNLGAGSTVTNQFGFSATSSLTGATNNYGFYSNIASGTGRWNFYASGTAANVFVGTTSIGGIVGSESLRVTPVASAVNYINVQGGATGGGAAITTQGSDTNVGMFLSTKGAGQYFFSSNSVTQFNIGNTASTVNYLRVDGGATGNAATLSVVGSDTNIDIALTPKGTGGVVFPAGAVGTPSITTTGDTNTGMFFPAADTIAFAEGGTETMRITSTGDVGIGTSSPSAKLSVGGSDAPKINLLVASGAERAFIDYTQATTIMRIDSDGDISLRTNNTESIRINAFNNVGIGTASPNASAILDVQSTTKGVRMPNMTTAQKNAIASPAAGLMVFDTTLSKLCVYTTAWETITSL